MKITNHYLEDLEEAETALWVREGLDLLENFVRSHNGDDDLLDLIAYLKVDNEQWSNPEFEEQARQAPKSISS